MLAPWIELARQLYHSFCKLIVYPGSSTGVAEAIHCCAVKAKMADLADGEYVMPFIAQGWLVLVLVFNLITHPEIKLKFMLKQSTLHLLRTLHLFCTFVCTFVAHGPGDRKSVV